MPVTITPTTSKIINNLSDVYNFCLDKELFIEITDANAKFVKLKYTISFKGKTYISEFIYSFLNGKCRIEVAKPVQPYIFLTEEEINTFFSELKLDMVPADVTIEIKLQDEEYNDLETFSLTAKFHAGYSKNIPEDGSVIERSLNYNTFLPLAYRYPTQDVVFNYRERSKTFNKQTVSSELNIFQMMFIQKYHFADDSMIGGFSSGFSSGFATADAVRNSNPFFRYEEGWINEIVSAYTIKGINFPWQPQSVNIIWLDENNIFQGMTFTGTKTGTRNFTHYLNKASKDFRNRKAGTKTDKDIKINSGWKLLSEIRMFESLISSKRAWIFEDFPENRKEISVFTAKLAEEDDSRELVDFDIEFSIDE